LASGNEIASESGLNFTSITQVLVEATFHKGSGIWSQISYIQRINTKGGLPPKTKDNNCSEKSVVIVPFEAEFWFYTQDLIPPSVPDAIAVPSDNLVVEGFFCKGILNYSFDGSQWQTGKMHGKLYNVPGGDEVGSFYSNGKPDDQGGKFYLEVADPNGWTVVGHISGSAPFVDNYIPWLLFKVTSSSGNVYVSLLLKLNATDFPFFVF
jgi:hypothetical protein